MTNKMKLAHLSDIHWFGIERHEEYKEVFNKVFASIRSENVDAIVITGDIFHTKTHGLTPEVIQNMSWMFQQLAEIAPVYTTLGNHDGNLKNEYREDSITPIINALNHNNKESPIVLMKPSGNYELIGKNGGNPLAYFSTFSCFDEEGWVRCYPQRFPHNVPAIALFHGSVSGCLLDNNHELEETEVEAKMFDGYDFCLLGDIHKRQSLGVRKDKFGKEKTWIAYAGSLIQQNFGEETKKGYLIWEIEDKDSWNVRFIHIPNRFGFVTIPWTESIEKTTEAVLAASSLPDKKVRIKSLQKLTPGEKQVLENLIKTQGAADVSFDDGGGKKITTAQAGSVSVQKHSLRTDPKVLAALYEEYLKQNAATYNLSTEQKEKGKTLLSSYMTKVNEADTEGSVRDVVWSLKSLEFSNLYKYDENNEIRFENLKGIAYIAGKNMTGKSSIIGSLTYGLFNATDRGPVKSFHIVNSKKQQGKATAIFSVGGEDYAAVRTTSKRGKPEDQKAATSLNFYKFEGKEKVEVAVKNDDTRPDTDKSVRKLIGSIQDFILTSFINDDTLKEYINQGSTQRKEILNKFLDLDVFSQLYKLANADLTVLKNKTASHAGVDFDKTIEDYGIQLRGLERSIKEWEKTLEEAHDKRLELQTEKDMVKEFTRLQDLFTKKQSETASLNKTIETAKRNGQTTTSSVASLENTIATLESDIQGFDEQKLNEIRDKTVSLSKQASDNEKQYAVETAKFETQKKSVKRLDLVPCGDSFPQCGFIKDSHENKTLIASQQELVEKLSETLQKINEELDTWKNERAEQKLKTLSSKKTELTIAKNSLNEKRKLVDLYQQQLSEAEESLALKAAELQEIQVKLHEFSDVDAAKEKLSDLTREISKNQELIRNGYIQTGALEKGIETLTREKSLITDLIEQQKVLESVVMAFHKNGIPALILQSQLPQLNDELNSILSGIVKFKLSVETEPNSNTLDIFIEDEHSRRLIELASGAEKTLTSIALRVALYNLTSLPKSDMLLIDEGFGALDAESMDSCLNLLTSLKSKFRLILIIAHQPQVKEIADTIIEITATKDLQSHVSLT